jgi:hypothetical protein
VEVHNIPDNPSADSPDQAFRQTLEKIQEAQTRLNSVYPVLVSNLDRMANKIHLTTTSQMKVDTSFCKSLMESVEYSQVDEIVKAVQGEYDECLARLKV